MTDIVASRHLEKVLKLQNLKHTHISKPFIFLSIQTLGINIFISYHIFPGFKWQRQLMFRSKLTMHTAYDRKDNAEPASITALTVSKDHKILYVGEYSQK